MSEDTNVSLEDQIEMMLDSEEADAESEVESDTETEEVEGSTESDSGKEETESDSVSEETSDAESEVDFDFRNTSTSIQQLVANLKTLPEAERNERISKITREKELAAVKEAFPDAIKEEVPVSREEYQSLREELADLKQTQHTDELKKALEIAQKLNATESLTDSKLQSMMLQEQFGDSYQDVANDPQFIAALVKFPSLPLEDRLSYACSMSKVARKMATDGEIQKQVRLANTKTVSKGKQTVTDNKMTAKDVDSLDKFERLMAEKFDD